MPRINDYICNKCGYSLPSGWGGYMYVIDDSGKRIVCPHPGEMFTVSKVLGENASIEVIKARTGFNSDCVCLSCLSQFELDIGNDERRCPHCKSPNVKTVFELIGKPYPKCKEGTIKEIYTGIKS